jgi:hypothetical protein
MKVKTLTGGINYVARRILARSQLRVVGDAALNGRILIHDRG